MQILRMGSWRGGSVKIVSFWGHLLFLDREVIGYAVVLGVWA